MGSVVLPTQLILFGVVFEILFEVLVFGAISLWREQIGFPSSSWAALRLCLAHTTIDEALTFFLPLGDRNAYFAGYRLSSFDFAPSHEF